MIHPPKARKERRKIDFVEERKRGGGLKRKKKIWKHYAHLAQLGAVQALGLEQRDQLLGPGEGLGGGLGDVVLEVADGGADHAGDGVGVVAEAAAEEEGALARDLEVRVGARPAPARERRVRQHQVPRPLLPRPARVADVARQHLLPRPDVPQTVQRQLLRPRVPGPPRVRDA